MNTRHYAAFCRCIVTLAIVCMWSMAIVPACTYASTKYEILSNPDWEIELSDYGYSDILLDNRAGYKGREYLSGEWAAAVGYSKSGQTAGPTWLEPEFIYPDWTTNSNFSVQSAIADTGFTNDDGFGVFQSTIANSDLSIKMTYQMLDTATGIEQGTAAASGGSGSSTTSGRYVLKHTYEITNISGVEITGLSLFQFLHGLNSETAVYDDRDYGGALPEYRYDTTLTGRDDLSGVDVHDDTISFHSAMQPVSWETGYYGVEEVDSHGYGKPGTGVHLSVEADSLDGTDSFSPGGGWVSGAQKYGFGSLGADKTVSTDVLLSVYTETTSAPAVVPEPVSSILFVTGGALLGFRRYHGRKRNS